MKLLHKFFIFSKKERGPLIMAGIFIFLSVILSMSAGQIILNIEKNWSDLSLKQAQNGLKQELNYASAKIKETANSENIKNFIISKDLFNLLAIARDIKEQSELERILITDDQGLVLTRSASISSRGDYVFQSTAWGRKLSNQESFASIEAGAIIHLALIAGEPIKSGDKIIGAIVGGFEPNNDYAKKFKNKYLPPKHEVAFYSRNTGLTGTSFADPKTIEILNTNYLNPGSDWIQKGVTNQRIIINKQRFLVKNLEFNGLEDSPGGMLIFYPEPYQLLLWGASSLIALLFIILIILICPSKSKKCLKKKYLLLGICIVIVFIISLLTNKHNLDEQSINIPSPQYTIYNSTLNLDPAYGIFNKNFDYRIGIKLSTGGENINTAQTVLKYDPKKIKVKEILTINSFCSNNLFLEKEIDNQNGIIKIACLVPNPGFSEKSGLVAELLIEPLENGSFNLQFTSDSQVLANDGLGTDVLRASIGGSYQIVNSKNLDDPNSSEFLLSSPSNPNSEIWSNNNNPRFIWRNISGYRYLYEINQSPDQISFENLKMASTNSVIFRNLKDGVYYFHLAGEKNKVVGTVSSFKIKIDQTPPAPPNILSSDIRVPAGQIVRLKFESSDNLSGLERGFYIKIDDGLFFPTGSSLFTAFSRGSHEITVRVFDLAGNYADNSLSLEVY